MDDAILVLRLAAKDAEREVANRWEEVQKIEEEIKTLEGQLVGVTKRYEDAADWLDGILAGLEQLERLNGKGEKDGCR